MVELKIVLGRKGIYNGNHAGTLTLPAAPVS